MKINKKAALHNLGCKVNAYETEAMQQILENAGYEIVPFTEYADVYVVNTCSVTNMADRKSRQMLHKAKKMNPDAIVVGAGCYVQTKEAEALLDDTVDIVIGNNKKHELLAMIEAYENDHGKCGNVIDINHEKQEYEEMFLERTAEHTRAFIKVQDGCNQFCSYCIIPFARGRVRSRNSEDVIREVKRLAEHGFREIVLTGIHLSSYGVDTGDDLLHLIREVHKVLPDTAIWLGGPEVSYDARKVLEDLLAALREEYANTDPELSLTLEPLGHEADQAMDEASGRRCAELMYLLPYGVMKYDSCDRDVILNSVNTVRVTCENGVVEYEQMIRSPIDAYKWELVDRLRILAELTGASLVVQDSYAGWPFRKDSPLQQLCCQVYNRLTGQELKIEKLNSCAETGEIAGAIPDMDIVALAPWGRGAHTPREHLDLDTLQPFWEFLTALLRAMCEEA